MYLFSNQNVSCIIPCINMGSKNILAITRKAISDLGKSSYIAVSTGFWYEWSLGIPAAFGFDFANHAVTYFDEGETKISVSTWPQVHLPATCLEQEANFSRSVAQLPLSSVYPLHLKEQTKKPVLKTTRTR